MEVKFGVEKGPKRSNLVRHHPKMGYFWDIFGFNFGPKKGRKSVDFVQFCYFCIFDQFWSILVQKCVPILIFGVGVDNLIFQYFDNIDNIIVFVKIHILIIPRDGSLFIILKGSICEIVISWMRGRDDRELIRSPTAYKFWKNGSISNWSIWTKFVEFCHFWTKMIEIWSIFIKIDQFRQISNISQNWSFGEIGKFLYINKRNNQYWLFLCK